MVVIAVEIEPDPAPVCDPVFLGGHRRELVENALPVPALPLQAAPVRNRAGVEVDQQIVLGHATAA